MTTTHDVPMPEPDCGTIRVGYKDISLGYSEEAMRAYADARCAQESAALISLLADIRAAAGDPTGKLDWPGLVEHVAKLQEERDALAEKVKALQDDLREVNRCNRPDCPHAGNYDAIDAAGGDPC